MSISVNDKKLIDEKYDPQEPRKDKPIEVTDVLLPGKNCISILTRMQE